MAESSLAERYAAQFDGDVELAAIWVACKVDGDTDARSALALTYTPLVRYVVSRLNLSLPPSLERGDLVGFGMFGLFAAIEHFDLDRGLTFQTYAVTRIRGSILDELRALDWVPRSVRSRMRTIDKATEQFEQEHGSVPEVADIADLTGLGRGDVRSALAAYQSGYLISLDERMTEGDGDDEPRGQQFVDATAELPDEVYDHEESQQLVREAISRLPLRDRAVVALYYYEELTFAEIGRVLGVSESRACQLHGRALKELAQAG